MKKLRAIAAVTMNWGIGYNGNLIYRISEDMVNFRKKTIGQVVIMGRKTLESLPNKRPLPHRINIVLSQNDIPVSNGVIHYNNIPQLLHELSTNPLLKNKRQYVIGGGTIYAQLLPYCDIIELTRIHKHCDTVDTFFPDLKQHSDWVMSYCSYPLIDSTCGIVYRYETWEKKHINDSIGV